MDTLRFSFFSLVLFVLAFVGISWVNKGFPVMAMRAVPMAPVKPDVRVPTFEESVKETRVAPMKPEARVPTFEESVKDGGRKDWENSKTAQSDGDKERDKLRLALWQAAIGYKLSPCDDTMKKNLVTALTRYTEAWASLAGCRGAVCGDDKKLNVAAASFKTAADERVHASLREAFDQGGITRDDFPKPIRTHVLMWSGMPFGEPEAACMAGRKREAVRR